MNGISDVEVAKYSSDPDTFLALIDSVPNKLIDSIDDSEFRQRHGQLIEVSRSIDQLAKHSIPIPDELRNLKLSLLADIEDRSKRREELEVLIAGIEELLACFESSFSPSLSAQNQTRRRKRQASLPNTKESSFRPEIIDALRALGGAGIPTEVKAIIEERMKARFLPGDLEKNLSTHMLVWKTNVHWSRFRLKEKGIIRSDSPKGLWELSEDYK